jgi:hypothetical protein
VPLVAPTNIKAYGGHSFGCGKRKDLKDICGATVSTVYVLYRTFPSHERNPHTHSGFDRYSAVQFTTSVFTDYHQSLLSNA